MNKKYCLGIDQGGTKTDAVIMDSEGNILAKGQSGGACYISSGMEETMSRIWEASEQAIKEAGISLDDIEIVVSCMTGADWDFEYVLLKENLQKLFNGKNVLVYNDCMAGLRSGSDALQSGIIVMGTGGNIGLRNKDGEQFIFGYYVAGAFQGAGALGRKGIDAVTNAFVGLEEPTSLTAAILKYTGTENPEDLLIKITMGKISIEYKSISPIVFEEAAKGDKVSKKLIADMAYHLARHIYVGAERLDINLNEFELVLSGGMFKGKGYQMSDELRKNFADYPDMKITDGRYEPVVGSGLLGLDIFYNRRIPDTVMQKIENDCKRLNLIRK